MKSIRLAFISFIFLVIIITIISLFIPSHIRFSRVIQINAPKDKVMEKISDPLQWRAWYPGGDSVELYYEDGILKGITLDKRKGQNLIIAGKKKDEVMAEYTMPHRELSTGWQLVPAAGLNSVTVEWYIDFHLRWYPWEKFSSFMLERVYGPQLEEGLRNLKVLTEK